MQRKHQSELLDDSNIDPAALSGNLRDIARLNRWSGTTATVIRAVAEMLDLKAGQVRYTVIDIGTGSGDLPAALVRWAARRHLPLSVFGGDLHAGILDHARCNAMATGWLRFDATYLPLATHGVDIAVCTQMAHHLEPEHLKLMLLEMQRVCRIGFIIVDLERSKTAHSVLWLVTRLISRNRLTIHDGPLSIERAYTRAEIAAIARSAGIPLCVRPMFPFRWIATSLRG